MRYIAVRCKRGAVLCGKERFVQQRILPLDGALPRIERFRRALH